MIYIQSCSNVDKIREFIKNVYVDRKYAGGRTSEKPPRDMQVFSWTHAFRYFVYSTDNYG